MTAITKPKNATNNYMNYTAMFLSMGMFWWCREETISGVTMAILVAAAYALPILLFEVLVMKTPTNPSVGLDFSKRETVPHRIITKLIGLYASIGFIGMLYWLFPEYHGSYYNGYWEALQLLGPYILILSIPYFVFMDERMKEPQDSYYWFGKAILLDFNGVKGIVIAQHILGWVVKGFFLPLMLISFIGNLNHLSNTDYTQVLSSFPRFFSFSLDVLYTVDLLAAVSGYALAIRFFDTHIRSSEPTMFGWFICTICYQPFLSVYMRYYLAYSNNNSMDWLKDSPNLQIAWGSVALLFLTAYTLASINFGCRFSNLTHRGVLTGGMYRFTKHPAYVSKNTFWWMLHVPFLLTNGILEAIRFCILLAGVNLVYYLRARTEERHLSRDPVYVQYALYMNEHSIFRGLAKRLPFLRYKPPANWQNLPPVYNGIKG